MLQEVKKKSVKLGVVGLKRGRGIATDGLDNENIVIRAICDRNPELLESARIFFQEENGIKDLQCYSELDDLLQSDVDAVLIATDAPLHTRHAIKALEAGKHVLSEIPISYTLEEINELKATVEAHPELKYMVGENACYVAHIRMWKQMRENGMFGDIVYAEGDYLHAGDPEKFSPEAFPADHWRRHLSAIRYSTHQLGSLLHVMDDRCVSVSCMAPKVKYNPYKQGAENGVAIFHTEKGAVIRVFVCFGAYVGGSENNYKLYGTRGSIDTGTNTDYTHGYSYAKLSAIPGTLYKKIEIPISSQFVGEKASGHGGADGLMLQDFVNCIIEDTAPPLDVNFGIAITLPGIIAVESAAQDGVLLKIPKID